MRTDIATARKMNASLINPAAAPPAGDKAAKVQPQSAKASPAQTLVTKSGPVSPMSPASLAAATPAANAAPSATAAPAKAQNPRPAAPAPVQAPAVATSALVRESSQPQITLRNLSTPEVEEEHISELMLQRDTEPLIKLEAIQSQIIAAKPAPMPKDTKVTIVNGVGELELQGLNPGKMELVLQDQTTDLQMQEHINVKPAEPVEVVWTVPRESVVGEDLAISIQALDEHGNVCLHYNDQFVVQVRGPNPRDLTLNTHDGQALIKLNHIKAEQWTVTLQYSGEKSLKLPDTRTLEWQPGPAARLVLDGPHEYIAGRPAKVKVKAVDVFGNVAKHFQGTVALEVKAS